MHADELPQERLGSLDALALHGFEDALEDVLGKVLRLGGGYRLRLK